MTQFNQAATPHRHNASPQRLLSIKAGEPSNSTSSIRHHHSTNPLKKTLKELTKQAEKLQGKSHIKNFIVIDNNGRGELALLLALMYPDSTIHYYNPETEAREILEGCAQDFVANILIIDTPDPDIPDPEQTLTYTTTHHHLITPNNNPTTRLN